MTDRADFIVNRNPALILASRSESPAEAELEQRELPFERSAFGRLDDAGADARDADARVGGGSGRGLPVPDQLGQKTAPVGALLVELVVAAIAVVADSGAAHQYGRPRCQLGQPSRQQIRAHDPAMADLLLLRRCPSSFGDALPSQVYDRLD